MLTVDAPSWDTTRTSLSDNSTRHSSSSSSDSPRPQPLPSRPHRRRKVDPQGLTDYLTRIIASPLAWLPTASARDAVWELASTCLSARSGRTGMSALTRSFRIPLPARSLDDENGPAGKRSTTAAEAEAEADAQVESSMKEASLMPPPPLSPQHVDITLHEPALTGDRLGFKTWASSWLLARRLASLTLTPHHHHHHLRHVSARPPAKRFTALELGSGTGLVGIAAAAVLGTGVVLTDTAEIVEGNLGANVEANRKVVEEVVGSRAVTETAVLDWNEPERARLPEERFEVVLAADCVYEKEHPRMLARTVSRWLSRTGDAVFVVESPVREGFRWEMEMLREEMESIGLEIREEGNETGVDDWSEGRGDELKEIECRWTIWGWKDEVLRVVDEGQKI
ncbi:MAG: hypothetical protein Q9165_008622 [Trypethelium subeluteriae]